MRSVTRRIGTLAVLAAVTVVAGPSWAQCSHLTGSPPPVSISLVASKIVLRKGAGAAFGDGNDRFKILKGFLPITVAFDPTATESVHITLRHTSIAGPVMLAISLPPVTFWSSPGPGRFLYLDPAATLDVRKIILKDIGLEHVWKVIGRNASIASPPGTGDAIHVMVEIENAGVGECFEDTLNCTATSGGANCS